MATAKDRAQAKAGSGLNDDIGEQKRLELYRTQVVIREAEQRAYDLFLQNLVKGTSHLSLGQEAVAAGFAVAMKPGDLSFCTYRGHAHTLARGVPVATRTSQSASSAMARRTLAPSTRRSISPRCGSFPSYLSAKTISTWNTRRSAM